MKWRVLVVVLTGIAMIYFVSLFQDTPYPHPLIIQATEPEQSRLNEPNQVILSVKDDYFYRTHIHYKAVLDVNKNFIRGIDPLQTGVQGLVRHARKKKMNLLDNAPETEWEQLFEHLLDGPISKVSKMAEDSDTLQFSVLYHVIKDELVQHFVRVYYFTPEGSTEYKDLLFPGSTMINTISLEQNSIIYSRDPDIYRFRIAMLPSNLMYPPHSNNSTPILLDVGQTGDMAKVFHQPRGTESHIGLLCQLYSPNSDTYRVLSLDIHKTKHKFHSNVTIADGKALVNEKDGYSIGEWIYRDHLHGDPIDVIIDDSMEYMAFVDGAHFHQEKTVVKMPKPSISRSKDSKTMVVSLMRNNFLTLDFTDNLDAIIRHPVERDHVYKDEDGNTLNEYYHSMQAFDSVEPKEAAYDPTDIRGVQLNANATLLAIWTESNSVYIYKRGSPNRPANNWTDPDYLLKGSPHHLEKPSDWILCMVISPKEGLVGSITPIGAALFWEHEGSNYLSIGMKNVIVNTYLVDEIEEQKVVNFQSFLRDKWEMWVVMSLTVLMFAMNEYKTYNM